VSRTGLCPRCRLPRHLVRNWVVDPRTKVRSQTEDLVIEAHETGTIMRVRQNEYPIPPDLVADRVELGHCAGSGQPAYVAPPLRAWRCVVEHYDEGQLVGPTHWGSPGPGDVKAEAEAMRRKYGKGRRVHWARAEFLNERQIMDEYEFHLQRQENSDRDYMLMLEGRPDHGVRS